jgi:uncharacterized protein YndB with AHSA1/START domain
MSKGLIATSEITINAPASKIWKALTDPATVKKIMFGADVITDWKEGSTILYKGMWQGKPFEDKGKVVTFQPEKLLVTTHWSPLSGTADTPENYHTVSYELKTANGQTQVTLTQDNNATEEEKKHSQANWNMMLESLKRIVEIEAAINYTPEVFHLEEPIEIFCVTADTFPQDVPHAHELLHKLAPPAAKRKYFGISWGGPTITYKAGATEVQKGELKNKELEEFIIKKGDYLSIVLTDFNTIKDVIAELIKDPRIDPKGYCVEMYLDEKTVRCMVTMK